MVKGIKVGWPPLNSGLYEYKKTLRDVTTTEGIRFCFEVNVTILL